MYRNLLILTFGLSIPALSFAEETGDIAEVQPYPSTQFGLTAGLTFGGDELGGIEYEGGGNEDVSGGGLMAIGAAIRTQYSDQILSKLTANYHFDTVTATNADISFDRITLEALAGFKPNEAITIYTGFAYHISPKYTEKMDGFGSNNARFDSSLGFVIEASYNTSFGSEISVRYVSIDYDLESLNGYPFSGNSIDGSHLGIYYTGYF